MRCILFHFSSRTPSPGFVAAHPSGRTLAIFLILAFFASATAIRAQETATQEAAKAQTATQDATGTISGAVFLPGGNEPASQVAISLKSHSVGVFRSIL